MQHREKPRLLLSHDDDADVRAVCNFLFTNQLQQQPAACVKMCGARERLDLSVSERGKLGTAFDLSKQVNRLSEAQRKIIFFSSFSALLLLLSARKHFEKLKKYISISFPTHPILPIYWLFFRVLLQL